MDILGSYPVMPGALFIAVCARWLALGNTSFFSPDHPGSSDQANGSVDLLV